MKSLFMLLWAACAGLAMASSEPHLPVATPATLLLEAPEAISQLVLTQQTEAPVARRKGDVPYVPTPHDVVAKMLEMAEVSSEDVVYDLGSGDGRIVIAAIRDHNAKRGIGIDINPERIEEANENARESNVTERVTFREGNIFEEDFSEATVITLYLLPAVNLRLRPRLLDELPPGTRIVSHAFNMGEWEPDQHEVVKAGYGRYNVYFWRTPANVTGTWKLQLNTDGKQQDYSLELEQQFQQVSGTMRGGGIEVSLADARVEGETVTFTATPEGQEAWRFTGTVKENTIAGTLKQGDAEHAWRAERDPETRRPLEVRASST